MFVVLVLVSVSTSSGAQRTVDDIIRETDRKALAELFNEDWFTLEDFGDLVLNLSVLTQNAALWNLTHEVDDIIRETDRKGLAERFNEDWFTLENFRDLVLNYSVPTDHAVLWDLTREVLQYSQTFHYKATLEFFTSVGNVSLESLRQNLNVTCGEHLERSWTEEVTNKTCVNIWLKNLIEEEFQEAAKKVSPECGFQTRGNFCTSTFGENFVKNSVDYFNDQFNVIQSNIENSNVTLYNVLLKSVFLFGDAVGPSLFIFNHYHSDLYTILNSVTYTEPFKYDNLLRAKFIKFVTAIDTYNDLYEPLIKSREEFTWGIIRSRRGKVEDVCSVFRDIYAWNSKEYNYYYHICYLLNILQSHIDLLRCVSTDETLASLSWSTLPSAFFHSPCLCLAYNGTECRVKAPEGVEPLTYCLSVLLGDFQKQVSFRPALTYIDYSFMTQIPTCQFTSLLQERFFKTCKEFVHFENFDTVLSLQCSFNGLVNGTLNCSEMSIVDSYNTTFLCNLYFFASLVNCDADADTFVPFYSPGASTLVQVLTYLDVSVRLLTLVTYLACPQLRNLPGKLLIGYLATALLRLLVVRATLEDLAVAVRVDVASDLSSTLWLSSFLHFLTSSIKTLRLPDSLSPQEARGVLLRYSLLGWALPAALSASFFFLDEAFRAPVQCGQLLFVLCYCAALLWNLYMLYFNCKFYYDVKKDAVPLRPGAKARSVFTGLLDFALKTSVLSGAGIIFRLLFTQIQGLEQLLGYYHALGTLQGLLVFLFYGCNRESRDFWRRVLSRKLLPCLRPPQNRVV